ncbi:MAG: OprD family outer membrane porin [Sulfuricurvum sp.]|uniref:OprD family outer membrane porin n=1 Tax=Sulfuricurvum sp. TaxID=2025608 RepID=UPI0025DDCBA9|nr:OprD family outer membrane porin [Sulfuricurvum sp.]MCI4405741.1 OprD family outer membrane porin [Sulfuricurvum sp.]
MRGTVSLSLLASALVVNAMAADSLESMFKEGKASGQLRAFYIDRDSSGASTVERDGLTIGGYLKYETGSLNGLSAGTAFYTTNKLDNRSSVPAENDLTLFGPNGNNESYLGEAYLQYKYGNTAFKAGRQKLDTPLAGSDDARMLPSLFEAYVLSNTDVKDTTLIAVYVTKFAAGTFANAYTFADATLTANTAANRAKNAAAQTLALTSGYSGVFDATTMVGNFTNMGQYAIGQNTNGVSVAAAIYSGIPGLKLQLWDYYAHDILNAIYAEANYGWSYSSGVAPYVAVQWINERDVGANSVINKVDSDFIAAKAGVKVGNFDVYGAMSHNSSDDSATIHGGTITPWGGMPAYTQGMVTRHQFMAGADAWKVAGTYNFKDMGANMTASVYYASFDVEGYTGSYTVGKTTEPGFDLIWNPEAVKNLQLRFRGNFPDKFKNTATTDTSWDEYRFIANYNF